MAAPTSVTISHLELDDPALLRPPVEPPRVDYELRLSADPTEGRWFYEHVGRDWRWTDRARWSRWRWRRWNARVETWVANVGGERAGYFELEPLAPTTRIAYLGLLRRFHGLGLGGELLTHAIRRGFELGSVVCVSTNTLDGPHALANYEARGMRVVRAETRAL